MRQTSHRFPAIFAAAVLFTGAVFADGWIGLRVSGASGGSVRVMDVCERGPANDAGVKRGDIISAVNGVPVADAEAFVATVKGMAPGAQVVLSVEHPRSGRREVSMRVGEKPAKDPEKACEVRPVQFRMPSGLADHIHPHKVRAAYAGVMAQEMTPELREYFGAPRDGGVLVTQVDPEGPAKGILDVGDVIVSAEGKPLSCGADLAASVRDKKEGDTLSLNIIRRGKPRNVSVRLDERERARFDIGAMFSGKGACSSDKDGECRFLWHWNEEDFQSSLKRLEEMFHGNAYADEMRKRAERQKMLEDKLLELQKKLREVQEQLRQKSAPPI